MIAILKGAKLNSDTPIVFIVEDADGCLTPRSDGTINTISALLELTDGILSGVFDTRIIATTNLIISELDPAVSRSMRLCRRIEVNALHPTQANEIYKRISGKDINLFTDPTILADIYKAYKDPDGVEAVKKKSGRIGFSNL
jgi:ATP-dependent 26S proteasome regulatory subunit